MDPYWQHGRRKKRGGMGTGGDQMYDGHMMPPQLITRDSRVPLQGRPALLNVKHLDKDGKLKPPSVTKPTELRVQDWLQTSHPDLTFSKKHLTRYAIPQLQKADGIPEYPEEYQYGRSALDDPSRWSPVHHPNFEPDIDNIHHRHIPEDGPPFANPHAMRARMAQEEHQDYVMSLEYERQKQKHRRKRHKKHKEHKPKAPKKESTFWEKFDKLFICCGWDSESDIKRERKRKKHKSTHKRISKGVQDMTSDRTDLNLFEKRSGGVSVFY